MKFFRFLLLLCLPPLLFCSVPSIPDQAEPFETSEKREIFIPRDERGLINPWGYFDPDNMAKYPDKYVYYYFDFLDLICYETFLENLSEEEIDRIDLATFL